MSTPRVPPTNEELEKWQTAAQEGYLSVMSCNIILCLIAEIERLRELCEEAARHVFYPKDDTGWPDLAARLRAAAEGRE